MARPRRTKAEREADTTAERCVHGAILGYQPYRMKPVHFATSFLLALTGRYYRLEYLNKASVPKTAPKDSQTIRDEYPSDRLHALLVERGILAPSVNREAFRTLRAHLNAAYNNDGSALSAVFPPYSTFGADYSAPSTRYISDRSKNHGHSGSFVVSVFEATAAGREALEGISRLLELPPPPLAALGEPLLDDLDEEWCDRRDELYGELETGSAGENRLRHGRLHDCRRPACLESRTAAVRLLDPIHRARALLLAVCLHDAPGWRLATAAG